MKPPISRTLFNGMVLLIVAAAGLIMMLFSIYYGDVFNTRSQGDEGFAWPRVGQAAVGSVEKGILGRSSYNEKLRPIASMAKVITALAVLEKKPFKFGSNGELYTVTRDDIEKIYDYRAEGGSVLPIVAGMKLTQYEALQRMLIASDNVMADILVEKVFGSKAAYVFYAQNMVQRMGLCRTIVADASGFNAETASTPSELLLIGIAALKNRVIAKIVAQQRAELPVAGRIKNTNQLLGMYGIIGIKTGTTAKAGSCLLFAARHNHKDGRKSIIVAVIMGDKNHKRLYNDTKELLASAKRSLDMGRDSFTGKDLADRDGGSSSRKSK